LGFRSLRFWPYPIICRLNFSLLGRSDPKSPQIEVILRRESLGKKANRKIGCIEYF
jgi:hypothetical protein